MLTERWDQLRPHSEQVRLWNSPARFKTVPAGRRSGKTELSKRKTVLSAMVGSSFPDARFFCGAPTFDQAKRIFWRDLKALIPPWLVLGKPNETELCIRLITMAEIWVVGLDKPARIEGTPWDGCIIDEIGNCKPKAWGENIRPALADRNGWAWLIGVPEGRNHYYDLDRQAQEIAASGSDEWDSFHWKSADILPASEIEAARRDLDELTFLQEFEASFVNFAGRAYYPYEARTHEAKLSKSYNPRAPLVLCLDFNVAPGAAVVAQEMFLPNGLEGTGVLGEVHIERNSNTPAVCRRFIKDWEMHKGMIYVYGDATGGADSTAAIQGSDWELAHQVLTGTFGKNRVDFRVPHANPRERFRVNSMNSRLKSMSGDIRLMVDPSKAPQTARDFEGVATLEGGSGELDKKKDPKRTHWTDALGYYVAYEFPVAKKELEEREMVA